MHRLGVYNIIEHCDVTIRYGHDIAKKLLLYILYHKPYTPATAEFHYFYFLTNLRLQRSDNTLTIPISETGSKRTFIIIIWQYNCTRY